MLKHTILGLGLAILMQQAQCFEPGWLVTEKSGLKLAIKPLTHASSPVDAVVEYSLTNESGSKLIWRRAGGDDCAYALLVAPDGKAMQSKSKKERGPKYSRTSSSLDDGKTWFGQVTLSDHFDFKLPGVYHGIVGLTLYKQESNGTQSVVAIESGKFQVHVNSIEDENTGVSQSSEPSLGHGKPESKPTPTIQVPPAIKNPSKAPDRARDDQHFLSQDSQGAARWLFVGLAAALALCWLLVKKNCRS